MKKNNPDPPKKTPVPDPGPNIVMTPVEFSPKQTGEDIGVILPGARGEFPYPVFVPLFILIVTLIYTTSRDIVTLNRQIIAVKQEIGPAQDMLQKSGGKQAEFLESMRVDLTQLGASDPVAAQIVREFFRPAPKQPAPANGAKNPADSSKPPAK